MRKRVGAAVACSFLVAACSGGSNDGGESSNQEVAEVADDQAAADVVLFGSGDSFSIEAALREIPASVAAEGNGNLEIEVADLLAASALVGTERPTSSAAGDEVAAWLGPLTGFGESTLFVPVPAEFRDTVNEVEAYRNEVGFAVHEVDATMAVRAGGDSLVVLAGDLEPAATLEVGDGDDYSTDLENRTVARSLGRPLRFATRGDLVAMTPSTDAAAAWLDSAAPRLAADSDLLAAARSLDQRGVVGAVVLRQNFAWSDIPTESAVEDALELPIKTPFATVGLGWGVAHGEAAITVAYVFADDAAASGAQAQVEAAFSAGVSTVTESPVSDTVALVGVAVEGSVVVAELTVPAGRLPSQVLRMVFSRDVPFVHAFS